MNDIWLVIYIYLVYVIMVIETRSCIKGGFILASFDVIHRVSAHVCETVEESVCDVYLTGDGHQLGE